MQDRSQSRSRLLTPQGVSVVGLVVDALLTAGKIAAGVVFRSQTILADGLHSGSDLITDVAVIAGVRVSQRPPDPSHPYGHRRVSTLVAMFVGAALVAAAAWIARQAILTLRDPPAEAVRASVPFWLALASVPAKEGLFHVTRWVGRRAKNPALVANAWHHRTDALSSLAAAAGLAGVLLGGADWQILDPITALVLAAFLVIVAARIVREAAEELVDRAPGEATLASIESIVAGTRGVRSYHAFRARKIGGQVEMDIHIQVDPELTVREGHDIAGAVKRRVYEADCGVAQAVVHIEPAEPEDNTKPPADSSSEALAKEEAGGRPPTT